MNTKQLSVALEIGGETQVRQHFYVVLLFVVFVRWIVALVIVFVTIMRWIVVFATIIVSLSHFVPKITKSKVEFV